MAVASLDLHYRMADCTSDFLKQLLCGTQRLCASATLGWVPFQGAEEETLGHVPWWPVNSIPGEENLYWLQEAQPGCLAWADAPPFLLPSNLPRDASLSIRRSGKWSSKLRIGG